MFPLVSPPRTSCPPTRPGRTTRRLASRRRSMRTSRGWRLVRDLIASVQSLLPCPGFGTGPGADVRVAYGAAGTIAHSQRFVDGALVSWDQRPDDRPDLVVEWSEEAGRR